MTRDHQHQLSHPGILRNNPPNKASPSTNKPVSLNYETGFKIFPSQDQTESTAPLTTSTLQSNTHIAYASGLPSMSHLSRTKSVWNDPRRSLPIDL